MLLNTLSICCHNRSSYLFRNRYKSLACDYGVYLLKLVRHIRLNPRRAGVVQGDELRQLGMRKC